MRKKALIWVFVFLAFVLVNTTAYAQDALLPEDFQISGDFAFYSKYVWRGFVLDEDPVLQPGIYMSYKGFSVSLWSSMDMSNEEGDKSDEIDYTIDYTFSIQKVNISLGHIYYDFPGINLHTKEYYLGVSYDGFLSPSLTWNHDYQDEEKHGGDGDYYMLALSHSFPIKKGLSLDISGHVGYNDGHFIEGTGGDIAMAAGFNIPLTKTLTVTPTLCYSIPYGDLEDEKDGDQDKKAYGGIVMGYSF